MEVVATAVEAEAETEVSLVEVCLVATVTEAGETETTIAAAAVPSAVIVSFVFLLTVNVDVIGCSDVATAVFICSSSKLLLAGFERSEVSKLNLSKLLRKSATLCIGDPDVR